ncbi:MAG: branched-chain amino acid ABC transporter permease [Deltaproteobacteria bacterium]|nr:branched-chain amino acid ABC transporter permease [Deltaproteobacteria bacterium]MBW2075345.1 branched-chain amino acid ABC transporter permease [Deltaproteobacteria bacterium]
MRPCGVFDKTYAKDIAIVRTWQHWTLLLSAIALLFVFPLVAHYYFINLLNNIFVTIIVVLGLQIVTGYAGQISFGQPAFMAVGAFCSAVLTIKFGFSFWLALPLSGIVAGFVGLIGGAPSLRIKGFYLAMATIAIFYVTMWVITHLKITGLAQGLSPPPPKIGNFVFDTDERMYYIILIATLILTFFARNLVRSRMGRVFMAIRDNDLAAEVMGVNLYYYKLLAFFISCFYAGIAGSLLGHWYMLVNAEQFTLLNGIFYIGMIIIGGLGSVPGVYFGVIFLRLLDELMLFSAPTLASMFPWLGMGSAASLSVMAFGLVLILFLIYEPRGVAHRWEIFKASYRLYPFRHSEE